MEAQRPLPGLEGETILCFAPDPWESLWRNRHQLMTRLARHNTVFYIEPRMYLWEAVRRARRGTLPRPYGPFLRHYAGGLWIYRDPAYAPYAGRLSGGPLTALVRREALRAQLRRLRCQRPILWLLRPWQADHIGCFDEKLVVYHVTDEYSSFPTVTDKAAFRAAEHRMLARADLVLVTSRALLQSKGEENTHTYLVPNAVDYARFSAAAGSPARLPELGEGKNAIQHPRVGYVGALNEKIDFGLLAGLAAARPGWSVVLVGGVDLTGQPDKATALQALPNVYWLGRRPVEDVPGAIAALDVCLLPYERNEWTAHIDSLKLYEYLACGRPVVATDVPAARAFAQCVSIASGTAGFVDAVEAALAKGSDPAAIAARQAVAAANTWDNRVAQIEQLLAGALARKASAPALTNGATA